MIIRENCSLADRNTFGMNVKADCLADWSSVEELRSILTDIKEPVLVMGGGSNLLFMSDFKGTVLHSSISTIDVLSDDSDRVRVQVGAGVVWDDFVAWCSVNGYWGVEKTSDRILDFAKALAGNDPSKAQKLLDAFKEG